MLMRIIHRTLAALAVLSLTAVGARAATVEQVKDIIVEESRETMVPSSLALAVAQVESGLRPDRQGTDGARGVFQILPEIAQNLDIEPRALWNPRRNVQTGLKVLDNLLDRTEGRWDEALRAYASLRPDRAAANPERYVSDVLGWERRYAERLALQDAVDGRRREVLMGHDDWRERAEPEPIENVGRDTLSDQDDAQTEPEFASRPSYMEPEAVDPSDDDDTDMPVEVRIYRGGRGTEVEITVYGEDEAHDDEHEHERDDAHDDEYEDHHEETVWQRPTPPRPVYSQRPPRPRLWKRPRPFSKPFGWRNQRLRPGPRWSPARARMLKRQARKQFGWRHR